MMMTKIRSATAHVALVALIAMSAAPAAFGQSMYRCGSGSGTYLSDRPCNVASPTVLRYIGPVAERPAYRQTYAPSMAKAPDILPYLSPACAEMNDAVRTGPARGLTGASMSELVTNYHAQCGEDEQRAHRQLQQAKSDARSEREAAQAAKNAERAQARLSVDQCHEMLGTLAGKRRRAASMTPGEQHDLELFETNYKARCKPG